MLSAPGRSSARLAGRTLRITPESGGLWAVRTDEEQLSTHPDASEAQRAARAAAPGAGATRLLLQDRYGRTRELPPVMHN